MKTYIKLKNGTIVDTTKIEIISKPIETKDKISFSYVLNGNTYTISYNKYDIREYGNKNDKLNDNLHNYNLLLQDYNNILKAKGLDKWKYLYYII